LAARRRAREIQAEDKKKIEDMLRRKREATEEVLVRLSQVDEVHAAAGQALQTLVDMGDQKDSLLRRGSRSSTGRVDHQYARKSTGKL
jgi:hypothetical protein